MEAPVIEQGSLAWQKMRCGRITASRIKDMMAKTKTGPSTSRKNLASTLMLERVLGVVAETFTNAAMEWGVTNEPLARLAYSIAKDFDVEEVPFVNHPTIDRSGASPDGLVTDAGVAGIVEIKCPNTSTHLSWAISGVVPPEHALQMQWQMACTGAKFGDFVSYDPRMPEGQQLFIRRLPADEKLIEELTAEVIKFDAEVEALVAASAAVQWFFNEEK
jgi:putative phage-type endonuclease